MPSILYKFLDALSWLILVRYDAKQILDFDAQPCTYEPLAFNDQILCSIWTHLLKAK